MPDWCEIDIELAEDEVDELILLLETARDDPGKHFHLTSELREGMEAVQLTFSQETPGRPGNAEMSSAAIPPGTDV